MTTSARLGIPFISNQQNAPEITHNTAVVMLQALALGAIALQDAPPGSPADGDTYIVGTAGSGAWAGESNKVATYLGGWLFIPGFDSDGAAIPMGAAQDGLTLFLQSEGGLMTWNGSHWYASAPAVSS